MKKFLFPPLMLLCLLLALPAVTGCGGGSDDDDDAEAAEAADDAAGDDAAADAGDGAADDGAADDGDDEAATPTMTGLWSGSFNTGVDFTLNLTQTGDALTGDYANENGATGGVAGTITGNEVELTITVVAPPVTSEFDGTVNDARTSMGGTYTIVAGGGGNGTWQVTK